MGDAYVIAQMSRDDETICVLAERPHEYVIWNCYGSDGYMNYYDGRYIPKGSDANHAFIIATARLRAAALTRYRKRSVYTKPEHVTSEGN